jgi:hypothetical protein
MSMVICERCDVPIDSDDDPECFCGPPDGMCTPAQQEALTTVLCERCREKAWDRQQERAMEDAP